MDSSISSLLGNPAEPPTPERAFRRSADYQWQGQPLQPYSFLRQTAALALGMRYGQLHEGEYEVCQGIPVYPALPQDIALQLWLMHQPDPVCREARRNPEKFEALIDEWAEAQGIGPNGEHHTAACILFFEVQFDVASTRGQPVPRESAGKTDAPPGNLSAPPTTPC